LEKNWVHEAKQIFDAPKPVHSTQYTHCDECAEHDETLIHNDRDIIELNASGNPEWDLMCFCSAEGQMYYMPAFIRLSLETLSDEFYLGQFLFHLEYDGENNRLLKICDDEQKAFVVTFLTYIATNFSFVIEKNCCDQTLLNVLEIWSGK